ncbi:MAG: HAD family hydrolase [Bacteroidetes bacterium]|nr:MAG: HAD family hydrolase [Bacteroidota bacterium]
MNYTVQIKEQLDLKCFHCGEECREDSLSFKGHLFCCQGCKLVFEILSENNLNSYYKYNTSPGFSPKPDNSEGRFGFLDNHSVKNKMLQFSDGKTAVVTFYIPQMHCSSCIWLLENLNNLIPAVIRSQVNFVKRTASITFQENKLSLRELVMIMAKIGYEPHLDMTDLDGRSTKVKDRSTIYRIGIAGFVFGNIMLFSFPEYFSLSDTTDPGFNKVFNFLNLVLSIPVLFYCSAPFFISAWQSLSQRILNIDVPIALGIAVMFIRSLVEIISASGSGYLDTMAGLVFFMLIGRSFQDKTYKTISFDRNYKSFFPISVMSRKNGLGDEYSIPVSDISPDDHIIIRNQELIPADAILLEGKARIDYSFVTGEASLHSKNAGDLVYAGGRHVGETIELKVVKEVSQSYLTQLWNQESFSETKEKQSFQNLVNRISHYFTIAILLIALSGWTYWLFESDIAKAWNAFTAVLIIACPCALAISSPFTLGNIIRIFGNRKFYLKNVNVIEKLAKVDTIVFDKTGTLTQRNLDSLKFVGRSLSQEEVNLIFAVVKNSSHPLSRMLKEKLIPDSRVNITNFKELAGSGLEATVHGTVVRVGSQVFTCGTAEPASINNTRVYISIDSVVRGYFDMGNSYRNGLEELISALKQRSIHLEVLSGDNSGEKDFLLGIFGQNAKFRFDQSPMDKLNAIKELQTEGRNVMMVGDGLNDSGALRQSNVGISVSDDVNNFSPASDAILSSESFVKLPRFLSLARLSHRIILISFSISLLYNVIGLYFALQGTLSPVIAAILMPISSVSIIVFTSSITNLIASRKKFN